MAPLFVSLGFGVVLPFYSESAFAEAEVRSCWCMAFLPPSLFLSSLSVARSGLPSPVPPHYTCGPRWPSVATCVLPARVNTVAPAGVWHLPVSTAARRTGTAPAPAWLCISRFFSPIIITSAVPIILYTIYLTRVRPSPGTTYIIWVVLLLGACLGARYFLIA